MSAINDGGPAFPTKREALDPRATGWSMQEGMTLRDWFAGQALASVMGTAVGLGEASKEQRADMFLKMSEVIYEMADAMIAAREVASA